MFPPLRVIELSPKGAGSAYHVTITSAAARAGRGTSAHNTAGRRPPGAARPARAGSRPTYPGFLWYKTVENGANFIANAV